jgi:hypothetical protein
MLSPIFPNAVKYQPKHPAPSLATNSITINSFARHFDKEKMLYKDGNRQKITFEEINMPFCKF